MFRRQRATGLATAILPLALATPCGAAAQESFAALYTFHGPPDSSSPTGHIVRDGHGDIFGIGGGGAGSVFEVSPPPTGTGAWSETVLWTLNGASDGSMPFTGGLFRGPQGALYGTALEQGGPGSCGTAFKLWHSAAGWMHRVLWRFAGKPDGCNPTSPPVLDGPAFYGSTAYGGANQAGTIYRLTQPAVAGGKWTEALAWTFDRKIDGWYPRLGLEDEAGNLYGSSDANESNAGIVWRMTPPAAGTGAWTETLLWKPSLDACEEPQAPRAMDGTGALYIACAGIGGQLAGTVYRLAPPAQGSTAWTPTLLWTTQVQDEIVYGGPVLDRRGNLILTTGNVTPARLVRLSPPASGSGAWQEKTLWSFAQTDGSDLGQPFTADGGRIFGLAGETASASGDVWEVSPQPLP